MVRNICKILLMSSVVALLLFVESSTGKPIQSKTGKKLVSKSLSKDDRINLDEQKHFEGDILIKGSITGARGGTALKHKLWPDKTIPYQIQTDKFNKGAIDIILNAMKSFESQTCLRFIERTTEEDYIFISPLDGCYSYVGKIGGRQAVSLGQGCIYLEAVKHELMHAVGFWHEQSRTDRDEHVTIHFDNIEKSNAYNFDKYDRDQLRLRTPYDYRSIMHYGPTYFAKDHSKPTISAKNGGIIGPSGDFTETDILDINRLYNCKKNGLGEYVSQR